MGNKLGRRVRGIQKGKVLGNLYKVKDITGQGSYGVVTKCRNKKTREMVAIKVIKNLSGVAEQAKSEIDILERLQCLDPDTCNIVRYNGNFVHKGQICIAFELLDQTLIDYMENREFEGLPMTQMRSIIHQLATALDHLKRLGIIHSDLKPDNIMIVDRRQESLKVKLIDFGQAFLASDADDKDDVQVYNYRAPEVMLGMPFNEAIDMWSLGVIVAELAAGTELLRGWREYDVLRSIIQIQGQPEDHMLDSGKHTKRFFKRQTNDQQRWRLKVENEYTGKAEYSLSDEEEETVDSLDELEEMMSKDEGNQSDRRLLVDLIKRMLTLDPEQRITPQEVLQHPFLSASSNTDTCINTLREDNDAGTDEVCQDCRVEMTTASPAAEMEKNNSVCDPQNVKLLENLYEVGDIIREGPSGVVTKGRNKKTGEMVAIKITKDIPGNFNPAKLEIAILTLLQSLDQDTCNIVRFNGMFFHDTNICIDFELLDQTLDEYMANRYVEGLPMTKMRSVIHQLATALHHLRSFGLIHSDLKHDNIMIVDRHQESLKVKLIDFSQAFLASVTDIKRDVQTFNFRAPEVMLGLPLNEAIDMWSLGVIVAELATATELLPGDTAYDVLRSIIQIQGQPEDYMLYRGKHTKHFFKRQANDQQRWRFKTGDEYSRETECSLPDEQQETVHSLDELEEMMSKDEGNQSDRRLLVDLIKRMLTLDPDERIKPQEVLQHPFLSASSNTDTCINTSREDNDAGTDEVCQDCRVEMTTASPAAEMEEKTEDVQAETEENNSWRFKTQKQFPREYSSPDKDSEPEPCTTPQEVLQHPSLSASSNTDTCINTSRENKASNRMAMNNSVCDTLKGKLLGNLYEVEDIIGEGRLGVVTKCRNKKTGEMVAIKITKDICLNYEQVFSEIVILKRLQCLDPDNFSIVRFDDYFAHEGNICINFELLDQTLNEHMENRYFEGLPMTQMRSIIHQLATALNHLKSFGLIHSDLKNDNIRIVDRLQESLKVKLIDFSQAFLASDTDIKGDVQTFNFRAPEAMLGVPLTEAIDMWSLGVVVAELATGIELLPGKSKYDVLRFIIQIQGQPEDYMLDRGYNTRQFFKRQSNDQQRWRFKTKDEYSSETECSLLGEEVETVRSLDKLEELMSKDEGNQSDRRLLVDLIKRMLTLDPEERIKPQEVLQHPFLSASSNTDTFINTSREDNDAGTDEVCQDCRVEMTTASPAAEMEKTEDVQAETEENNSRFRRLGRRFKRLGRRIRDTFRSLVA